MQLLHAYNTLFRNSVEESGHKLSIACNVYNCACPSATTMTMTLCHDQRACMGQMNTYSELIMWHSCAIQGSVVQFAQVRLVLYNVQLEAAASSCWRVVTKKLSV